MKLSEALLKTCVNYHGAYVPLTYLSQEDLTGIVSSQSDLHAEIGVQLALKKLQVDDSANSLALQKALLFTQYKAVFDQNIEVISAKDPADNPANKSWERGVADDGHGVEITLPTLDLNAIAGKITDKHLLSLHHNGNCVAKAILGDGILYVFTNQDIELSTLPCDYPIVILSTASVAFWGQLATEKSVQVMAKSICVASVIKASAITLHSQEITMLQADLKATETIELCQQHLHKTADCDAKQILIVSETATNRGATVAEDALTLLGRSWRDTDANAVMHAKVLNQYMADSLHQKGHLSAKIWTVKSRNLDWDVKLYAMQSNIKMHTLSMSKQSTFISGGDVICDSAFEVTLQGHITQCPHLLIEGFKITLPREHINVLEVVPSRPGRPYLKACKPQKMALARYLSARVLGAPDTFKPSFVKRCEREAQPYKVPMFSLKSGAALTLSGDVNTVDATVNLKANQMALLAPMSILHSKQRRGPFALQVTAETLQWRGQLSSTVKVDVDANTLTQSGFMHMPEARLSLRGETWTLESGTNIYAQKIIAKFTGDVTCLPGSTVKADEFVLNAFSAYLRGDISGNDFKVAVKCLALMTGSITSLKQSYKGPFVLFLGAFIAAEDVKVTAIFSGMFGLFCTGKLRVSSVVNLSALVSIQTAITNPSLSMVVNAAIGIGCIVTMILVPQSMLVIPWLQLGLMSSARLLSLVQSLQCCAGILKQFKQPDCDKLGLSIELLTVLATIGSLSVSSGMAAAFMDMSTPNIPDTASLDWHTLLTGSEQIIGTLVSALAANRQTTAGININCDPLTLGLGEFTTSVVNINMPLLNFGVSNTTMAPFQVDAAMVSANFQNNTTALGAIDARGISASAQNSITAVGVASAPVVDAHLSETFRAHDMLMVGSVVPGLPRTGMNVQVTNELCLVRPETITNSQFHFRHMDIIGGNGTILGSQLVGDVLAPHGNELYTQGDTIKLKCMEVRELWYDAGSTVDIARLMTAKDSVVVFYSNHTSIHEMAAKGQFIAYAPNPKDGSLEIAALIVDGGDCSIDSLPVDVKFIDAKNGGMAVISSSDANIGTINQDDTSSVEFIKSHVNIKEVYLNGKSWFVLEASTGHIGTLSHPGETVVSTQYSDVSIDKNIGDGKCVQHGNSDPTPPKSSFDFSTGILTYELPGNQFSDVAEVYGVRTLRFATKGDMNVTTTGFKCYAPLILESTEGKVIFTPKAVVMADSLEVVAYGDIKGQGAILMSNGRLALISKNGYVTWDPYTITTTTKRKVHHWFWHEWVTETHTTVVSGILVSQGDQIEIYAPHGKIDAHAAYVHAANGIKVVSEGDVNLSPVIANHRVDEKRLGLLGFSSQKHTWQTAHPTVFMTDNGDITIVTNGKANIGGASFKADKGALKIRAKEISDVAPTLHETITTHSFTWGPTLNGVAVGPNLSSALSLAHLNNAYAQFGAFVQAGGHPEQAILAWNTVNEIGKLNEAFKKGTLLSTPSIGFQIGYSESHITNDTVAPGTRDVKQIDFKAEEKITIGNGQSNTATESISMIAPKIVVQGGANQTHATSFSMTASVTLAEDGVSYGGSVSAGKSDAKQRVTAAIKAPVVHIEAEELTLDDARIEADKLSGHANKVTATTRLSESSSTFFSVSGSNTGGSGSFEHNHDTFIDQRAGIVAKESDFEVGAFEGHGAEVSAAVRAGCDKFTNDEVHETHEHVGASFGFSVDPNDGVVVEELGLNGPAIQMPGKWAYDLFKPEVPVLEETVVLVMPETPPSTGTEPLAPVDEEKPKTPKKEKEPETEPVTEAPPDEPPAPTAPSLFDIINTFTTEEVVPVLKEVEVADVLLTSPTDVLNDLTTTYIVPVAETVTWESLPTNALDFLNQWSGENLASTMFTPGDCDNNLVCLTAKRTVYGFGNAAYSFALLVTDPYSHLIAPAGRLILDIEIARPGSMPNQLLLQIAPEAVSLADERLMERAMMPFSFAYAFERASYGDKVEITATFIGSMIVPGASLKLPKVILEFSQGTKLTNAVFGTIAEFKEGIPDEMLHHSVPSFVELLEAHHRSEPHHQKKVSGLSMFGQVVIPERRTDHPSHDHKGVPRRNSV